MPLPFATRAPDQPAKVFRLGVLVVLPRGPGYGAFKERLHQLGYEEGRNLRIDQIDWPQSLGGDTARLPEMAAELVGRASTRSSPAGRRLISRRQCRRREPCRSSWSRSTTIRWPAALSPASLGPAAMFTGVFLQ
jgi:hypothetical protein